ncbi:MAG: MipA/OmpV family protein [Pseudomonadota bacterium]
MKTYFAIAALLCGCAPALAEPTHMGMPEGSKDVYLSALAYNGPSRIGSKEHRLRVLPLISAQWSNGVFINMNTVGVQLSDETNMEYGVMLTPSFTRTESKRRFTPEAGAFFKYQIAYGLGLSSSLMYGGTTDHRGLRLNLGAELSMPVAEHQSLGLNAGVRLANRSALQADYGVAPGLPRAAHEVRSGVMGTSISAQWRWQVSNKYSLRSSLEFDRLRGSAASSPRIEQADGVSVVTVLTYRF